MIRILTVLLFIAASVFIFSCGSTVSNNTAGTTNVVVNAGNSAPAHSPLPAATIDELASGRTLYMANCANCHKENGTGGEVVIEGKKLKPDNLTSAEIKGFSDDKIVRYIMNGVEDEGMPSFKGKLSEGEMRDIVRFVRVELQKLPPPPPPKS
jgi:mono/diheme cytochrome c family protein